jgi:phosphatidylglycerol---prolipoprotein diacylglyceryl transferase
MLRELFRIPFLGLPIYGYGLMLMLGVLAAIWLAQRLAKRSGLDPELFSNLGIIAIVSGVAGARLSHVLENWNDYFGADGAGLVAAFNISSGGLTYYGGFLGATLVCIAFGIWKRLPLLLSMDIVAPCVMVGLALGRVGCFLNGCCWGQVCTQPWAVTFPYGSPPYEAHIDERRITPPAELLESQVVRGQTRLVLRDWHAVQRDQRLREVASTQRSLPVHPTQLYSTLVASIIGAACLALFLRRPTPGRVFALMLLLEGTARFFLETYRVEPSRLAGLSFSMLIASGLVFAGVLMMILVRRPLTQPVGQEP